jgi:hypothetical protein
MRIVTKTKLLNEVFTQQPKKIRYRVTDSFGNITAGSVIDAYLLAKDGAGYGLVYHPIEDDECASLDICQIATPYGTVWESVNTDVFVNLDRVGKKK